MSALMLMFALEKSKLCVFLLCVQVVDVDMGSRVPGISSLRALPCPSASVWPQVVFDVDYPGVTHGVAPLRRLLGSAYLQHCRPQSVSISTIM